MIKKVGGKSCVVQSADEIKKADKLILPGVGHFDAAMERINSFGLLEALNEKALVEKVPILGICLGMQLLTSGSEEGNRPGLNWIPGYAKKFKFDNPKMRIPHMGWNFVIPVHNHKATDGIDETFRFYFVHSYHVHVENFEHRGLQTHYGLDFDSFIQNGNIVGAQFHPEKSHKFGMRLVRNFVEM